MNKLLYSIANWALNALPVDTAGRRVFDETLADWRREAAKASALLARASVTARASGSVLRCIAGVTAREIKLIPQSGVLLRVFLWVAGYMVAAPWVSMIWFGKPTFQVSARGYLIVSGVAYFFPVALILGTGLGRNRLRAPGLGMGFASLVVSFVLLGWGLPVANRAFLEANPDRVTNPKTPEDEAWRRIRVPGEGLSMTTGLHMTSSPPSMFVNDLTVTQLSARIAGGPKVNGWAAIRWLSFFGAYLSICALAPLLASALRERAALVRYPVMVVTAALLLRPPVQSGFGDAFSVTLWLGAFWIPVAWVALCLAIAGHRTVRVSEPITNSQ